MVVQHNLSAMNANRMLGITQGSLSKSTEKLSSGYAINRAADNAAGLSISEKMRKQIRGLDQASANAEDGISAVQAAEGALQEVTDMLQRMNELAVQSANGTNSEKDRSYIQDEINQLVTEIDRVAETTKFNETYLLKGDAKAEKGYTFSYQKWDEYKAATASFKTDSATGLGVSVSFVSGKMPTGFNPSTTSLASVKGGTTAEQNDLAKALKTQGLTVTSSYNSSLNKVVYSVVLNGTASDTYSIVTASAGTASGVGNNNGSVGTFEIVNASGTKIATITVSYKNTNNYVQSASDTAVFTASSIKAAKRKDEIASYYDKNGNAISANALDKYVAVSSSGQIRANATTLNVYDALGASVTVNTKFIEKQQDLTAALKMSFQVGADTSSNNKISINIDAMSAKGLGINGLKVDGLDSTNADNAVNVIAEALQKVSTQRSALGAVQNRLEHTIKNLDNIVENTTSAESAIRDTDMATEMVKHSNANILAQAGQSMLAQANQGNQGVLSLIG